MESLVAAWLQWYLFLLVIYHDIVRFHIPVHDSLAVAVIQGLLDKKAQRKVSKPSTNRDASIFLLFVTAWLGCTLPKSSLWSVKEKNRHASEGSPCSRGTLCQQLVERGLCEGGDRETLPT